MELKMALTVGAYSFGALMVLIAVTGLWMALRVRGQRRSDALEAARTDAKRWYDMLSGQLAQLSAGDDPVAKQALADAAERHNAAAGQLAEAKTVGHFRFVRRTVTEGLRYIGAARARLGLAAGPQGPPPVGPDGRPMYEEVYRAAPEATESHREREEARAGVTPSVSGVARAIRHQ
ncbi:MAG TPA: hypothetical protein VE172_01215 [Stackebrandtia sp.]|jgi:hypothetical protein|uniref:hypothetical protein n=1 Tax=Stackebrandtia sp. TaxID=2023065 RepID=UPI002D738842|nr:hypothetical protein [Stackebrandtia sp.]HZE37408.1 hypothetical protein [Stackebrandtia sp.]